MKIIIGGGGTGGHIYPGLALARYAIARDRDSEVLFVGSEKGLENEIVPAAGFPLLTIRARGFQRNFKQLGLFVRELGGGLKQAGQILKDFQPDVVLGTGGYVSAPLVLAARLKRYPVVLHEQNALPGMLNRYMTPFAAKVCLSFADTLQRLPSSAKVVFTGNPRASEVSSLSREESCRYFKLNPEQINILIYGGSRGAQKINEVVTAYLKENLLPDQVGLIYITGSIYYQTVTEQLGKVKEGIKLFPYLDRMPEALAAADLAVTRSGATTLAELTALGLPALLVPSPNVVDNHQYYNARLLTDTGAAIMLEEKDFNKASLQDNIIRLIKQPDLLMAMSENSKKMSVPDAVERLYCCLEEVAG